MAGGLSGFRFLRAPSCCGELRPTAEFSAITKSGDANRIFRTYVLVAHHRWGSQSARAAVMRCSTEMDASGVRRSSPILRKTMFVLATAAALTGGLTADAFARGGGGGGGGGHGGGGVGGGGHMGGGFGGAHM